MPGARCTRSLVCSVESTRVVTTVAPEHPAFPHAMVLTAYVVLSPATNSSCHRRQRIKVGRTRSGRRRLRQLDTSNGCQDHTVLPSASAPFVCAPSDRSRAQRTRPAITYVPDAAASTASHPASVTIAIRPSEGRDGGISRTDLGSPETDIFSRQGLDRQIADLPVRRIGTLSGVRADDPPIATCAHGC